MNRQQRELVELLRSGELGEDNRSTLLHPGPRRYSLAGAVCEMYRRNHPGEAFWHRDPTDNRTSSSFRFQGETFHTAPPGRVARWMGLHNRHGGIHRQAPPLVMQGRWEVRTLTAAYECGLSFRELADLIEDRAQDLFIQEER